MCSVAVRMQAAAPAGVRRVYTADKVLTTKACVCSDDGVRVDFSLEGLQQSVVDRFRRLELILVFLVCITSTVCRLKSALFAVVARLCESDAVVHIAQVTSYRCRTSRAAAER